MREPAAVPSVTASAHSSRHSTLPTAPSGFKVVTGANTPFITGMVSPHGETVIPTTNG